MIHRYVDKELVINDSKEVAPLEMVRSEDTPTELSCAFGGADTR